MEGEIFHEDSGTLGGFAALLFFSKACNEVFPGITGREPSAVNITAVSLMVGP